MSKMTLFGSMAMGIPITIMNHRTNKPMTGTITEITMESGFVPGKQPNAWIVTLTTDDDIVSLFVRTVD